MKFEKTRDVKDPLLGSAGAAGYDLHLPNDHERVVLHPKQSAKIMTGLKVDIPFGFVGLLLPRSSTGCAGLALQNTTGVIDSDYKMEVQVRARNWSETEDLVINQGERFVQLVVVPHLATPVEIVDGVEQNGRGGFGSSGK